MKKLVLIIILFYSFNTNAQVSEETKKMSALMEVLKTSQSDPIKMDSVVSEGRKLYNQDLSVQQRGLLKEIISLAKDFKNTSISRKEIKKSYDSFSKDDVRKFRYTYDKFKKVGFITSKRNTEDRINPYIAITDNTAVLKLELRYYGREWLFFEKVIFIIDGNNFEYPIGNSKRETLSSGQVLESSEFVIDNDMYKILTKIKDASGNVEYRFTGDKYMDFQMTKQEKENITEMLQLYNIMTE